MADQDPQPEIGFNLCNEMYITIFKPYQHKIKQRVRVYAINGYTRR